MTNTHKTIVFAPHHGRKTGHIPKSLMDKLTPKLVIVGEAPSDELDYYSGYDTITQNTAGDILFETMETILIFSYRRMDITRQMVW